MAKPRFDDQPLIDAYGDGYFRFGAQRLEGSILLTPNGIYPWEIASLEEASLGTIGPLLDCAGAIDFLIVGSGTSFARWPKGLTEHLQNLRIMPDFMDTGAAARTYNVLRSEDRRVAAALIAVP